MRREKLRAIHDKHAARIGTCRGAERLKVSLPAVSATEKPTPSAEAPPIVPWDNKDLPPRYLRHDLDSFPSQVQEDARAALADNDVWSIFVWGETGARKTTLAVSLLRELRAQYPADRARGIFLPAYSALDHLRKIGEPGQEAYRLNWQQARWLVLDDLGKHRDTPHVTEQLLFLIHRRYDNHVPGAKTIVTANMSLNDLARRVDPTTARRFEEGVILKLKVK